MDTFLILAISALGLAATIRYFFGVRKNRWLGKKMSAQAEAVFYPKDKEYVNIGGAIGFNFSYTLREPWKELKGTFTLFPRHSLIYMPISFLIGGADRFFANLYCEKKLAGEGHIIESRHLKRAKIDGIAAMERREIEKSGTKFVLLWRQGNLEAALRRTLNSFPDSSTLSHFCCFSETKSFFIYLKPKNGQIDANLKAFTEAASEYFR
ncbi:MAG: hypothetical protein FD137_2058 [Spirochaetes bacterium]|nr:MAG: hypothetical protein FD137_2058 [Spirochaetota bacterium]